MPTLSITSELEPAAFYRTRSERELAYQDARSKYIPAQFRCSLFFLLLGLVSASRSSSFSGGSDSLHVDASALSSMTVCLSSRSVVVEQDHTHTHRVG